MIQQSKEERGHNELFFKASKRRIDKLNEVLGSTDLTLEEEKTLLWLCNIDDYTLDNTVDNIVSILLKVKSQALNNIGRFNSNPPHPSLKNFINDFMEEQGLSCSELNNMLGLKQDSITELCDTGEIVFDEFEILCEYLKKSGKLNNLDKEYWLRHHVTFKETDPDTGEEYFCGSKKPYLDKLNKSYFQEEIQEAVNELLEGGYSAKYILDELEIMSIQIMGLRTFLLFAGETMDEFFKPVFEMREKVKLEMEKAEVEEENADEFYPFCD